MVALILQKYGSSKENMNKLKMKTGVFHFTSCVKRAGDKRSCTLEDKMIKLKGKTLNFLQTSYFWSHITSIFSKCISFAQSHFCYFFLRPLHIVIECMSILLYIYVHAKLKIKKARHKKPLCLLRSRGKYQCR